MMDVINKTLRSLKFVTRTLNDACALVLTFSDLSVLFFKMSLPLTSPQTKPATLSSHQQPE